MHGFIVARRPRCGISFAEQKKHVRPLESKHIAPRLSLRILGEQRMSNTETPQEQNPQEPLLGNEPAIEPVVEPIVAEHTDTLPSVEEQFRALFEPRGVVVAGASSHPGKFGFVSLHNILSNGYRGSVFGTNLNGEEVLGVSTVADIESTGG